MKSGFSSKDECLKELSIKKSTWENIARPANDATIKQARHAGDPTQAKDVSEDVLSMAFHAAREIIQAYIEYLDKKRRVCGKHEHPPIFSIATNSK